MVSDIVVKNADSSSQISEKGTLSLVNSIDHDFPHLILLRQKFANGGWNYFWRPYPEVSLDDALEFHQLERFDDLDPKNTEDACLMAGVPWQHPEEGRDQYFFVKYENEYGHLLGLEHLSVANTTTWEWRTRCMPSLCNICGTDLKNNRVEQPNIELNKKRGKICEYGSTLVGRNHR